MNTTDFKFKAVAMIFGSSLNFVIDNADSGNISLIGRDGSRAEIGTFCMIGRRRLVVKTNDGTDHNFHMVTTKVGPIAFDQIVQM